MELPADTGFMLDLVEIHESGPLDGKRVGRLTVKKTEYEETSLLFDKKMAGKMIGLLVGMIKHMSED